MGCDDQGNDVMSRIDVLYFFDQFGRVRCWANFRLRYQVCCLLSKQDFTCFLLGYEYDCHGEEVPLCLSMKGVFADVI